MHAQGKLTETRGSCYSSKMQLSDFGPVWIEKIESLSVLRDDRYPGGTKARILNLMIRELDFEEFVYAGHPFGLASVALAQACQMHGRKVTVFFPEMEAYPPPFYETQHFDNVDIRLVGGSHTQQDLFSFAQGYAAQKGNCYVFPIGFSTPRFEFFLTTFMRLLPVTPKEVWCIAGSGTLARCLHEAWPDADVRVVSLGFPQLDAGDAYLYPVSEAIDQPASYPPPFPSAAFYDAKAWRLVREHASGDALFWNVAA